MDAEPKPSTVKLMLVQSDSKPFLKTLHSTPQLGTARRCEGAT